MASHLPKREGERAWKREQCSTDPLLKLSSEAALCLIPPVNLTFNWREYKKRRWLNHKSVSRRMSAGRETGRAWDSQIAVRVNIGIVPKHKSAINAVSLWEVRWHIYIHLGCRSLEVKRWKGSIVMERDGQRGVPRVMQGEEEKDNGWGRKK